MCCWLWVPSPAGQGVWGPWQGAEGSDSGYKPDEFIRVWNFSREEGTWGQRGLCSRATPGTAELQLQLTLQLQRLPLALEMALRSARGLLPGRAELALLYPTGLAWGVLFQVLVCVCACSLASPLPQHRWELLSLAFGCHGHTGQGGVHTVL